MAHPVEFNILHVITLLTIHFFLRQKRALGSGVDEEQEQDKQEDLHQEHQGHKEQDELNQKHKEQDGLNQEHQEQEQLEQEQVGSREVFNGVGRYKIY